MDRHVATDLACIVHKHVKVTHRFERLVYDAIRIALLRVVTHDHRTSTQEPRSLLERLEATSCQRHFVDVNHQRRHHGTSDAASGTRHQSSRILCHLQTIKWMGACQVNDVTDLFGG